VAATIFLRAILNFVGVAMMIPLLMILLDRESLTSTPLFGEIYDTVGFTSYEGFVCGVCAAIVAIILVKNLIIIALYRFERDYIYSLYSTLSTQLFRRYFSQGLGFVKQHNSALLTRNVNVVSLLFVAGVLKPIATIIGEVMLLALLFVALLCYSPMAALLTIVVFIPIMALFYVAVRRRLNDIGTEENEAQRIKSRIVAESFRGYADIEIGGAFDQMLRRFNSAMDEVVTLRKRSATLGMLPQIFTEVGLAVALAALLIISLYTKAENMSLLFGIFAVAAVRLIPSMRNILASWSSIRLNSYSIDTMAEADAIIDTEQKQTKNRLTLNNKITIEELSFTFEDGTQPTIDNLSMEIRKGERLGIRGASGVGKTTLFNLLLGLYKPTAGRIAIDGVTLDDSNRREWQNAIGYVSQHVFIADMTLAQNITLGDDHIDMERLQRAIELADIKEFIDSLPNGVESHIGEQGCRLSGGQRQRIGIARALYKGCDILLFDEATSSLDNHTEENINNAIRRLSLSNRELTIVVIAHRESSLEYCDRVITMQ
jgi:ABC-type multidrug transport system fused ATPase/permease subunit